MPKFLNKITFLDSNGKPQTMVGGSSSNIPDTNALRDSTGRFQVGDTDASSTDGYIVINKNYVDGRISTVDQKIEAETTARQNKDSSLEAAISAEVTARQNAINALDKSDTAVTGRFVSAVSETSGIISVSRRAIVDSDGVVLKTGNQTITGTKTFESALRCTNDPSSSTDVVRKRELDRLIESFFVQTGTVYFTESTSFGTGLWFTDAGVFRVKAKYTYGSESGTAVLVFAVSKTYDTSAYSNNYEIKVLQNTSRVIATSNRQGYGQNVADQMQWIYFYSGTGGVTVVTEWEYEKLDFNTLGIIL